MTRKTRVFLLEVYRNPTSKCTSHDVCVARKDEKDIIPAESDGLAKALAKNRMASLFI